ncbi:MAG: DUF4440 domain-containing protein [Scytolyngbya sp. HA4215-MV1]|jgi:hypothetical protein|nr:DUF4440 domain-containing protein [Scytolyngbya sp. HA4215-MV1]
MSVSNLQEVLLRELEEQLLHPELRKSGESVAALLADEFFEFGSSGQVYDKQQAIHTLQNEPQEGVVCQSLLDFQTCVLAAGVVLVTYRVVQYQSSSEIPIYSLRSSIWKLIDNHWKMVFHQGTLTTGS